MSKDIVTVIIPCRNEEKYISRCLDSFIQGDYPEEKLEIIVADGLSTDNTVKIVRKYMDRFPFIRLIENPKKIVPAALNLGISHSKGNIIMIAGAHSEYAPDFVARSVYWIKNSDADAVGGIMITRPGNSSYTAGAIAAAISSPFAVGNAHFRVGSSKPREVDTVAFGAYRRSVFDRIGLFDEELVRNVDDEFNMRLVKSGGKILLVPDIVSFYYARETIGKVSRMFYQYSYFKPLVVSKVKTVLTLRQLVPSLFLAALMILGLMSAVSGIFAWLAALVLAVYFSSALLFSFFMCQRAGFKYLFSIPFICLCIHLSYGYGYIKGIWDFLIVKKQRKKKLKDMAQTR